MQIVIVLAVVEIRLQPTANDKSVLLVDRHVTEVKQLVDIGAQ